MSDKLPQGLPGLSGLPNFPRLSNLNPGGSETNTSVQVQPDSCNNRDRSAGAPSQPTSRVPSPARSLEPMLSVGRQSMLSPRSSQLLQPDPRLQPTQDDPIAPEDLLRCIYGTDSPYQGQKRPREAEFDDGPLAKRDRLEEELEALSATHRMATSALGLRVESVLPASTAPVASPISPDDIDALRVGDLRLGSSETVDLGTRRTLPVRSAKRRLPLRRPNEGERGGSGRQVSPSDDEAEEEETGDKRDG